MLEAGARDAYVFVAAGALQPTYLFASLFGMAAVARRRGLDGPRAIGVAFVGLAVAAYAAFWLTMVLLPGYAIAKVVDSLVCLTGIALAVTGVVRGQWRDEIVPPIALGLLATICLLLWVHLGADASNPLQVAASRWTHTLPPDSSIPWQFARAIASGSVPIGQPSAFFGDWLASDRPPLQTALFLVTPGSLFGPSQKNYQTAAVALQMFSLVAAWALAKTLGADRNVAIISMIAVFFAPFVLVNGAFVWPKLLAASFALLGAGLHFASERRRPADGALVGALWCFAMLSHGSSAFALLGCLLAAVLLRKIGTVRYMVATGVTLCFLYAPWGTYQKFVDPPADRLLKWHLAGKIAVDNHSFLHDLVESYTTHSWAELLSARKLNFGVVVDPGWPSISLTLLAVRRFIHGNALAARSNLATARRVQFYIPVAGMGIIGFFLYIIVLPLIDVRLRSIVITIVSTLGLWISLMFLPSTTVIHTGSYFPELAVIVVAVVFAARRWFALSLALVVGQVAVTVIQYSG